MASAQEFIRLDFSDRNRFTRFPDDILLAAANLLPEIELEITSDKMNGTELVSNISAKKLHSEQLVRTIVIPAQNLETGFLEQLLQEGPLSTKNVVVTGFTRVKSWGGVNDVHNPSFTLSGYVSRNSKSVVSLKGAAQTKFQDPKANVFDRFFGSATGTTLTIGGIIGGMAYLHFGALKEQSAAQNSAPQPTAELSNEIAQQGQIQK